MPEQTDPRVDVARRNLRLAVAMRETNYAETARAAGLSRNALSQFVAGRTSISYANMLRICDILDVPISLLHRPDSMTEARIRLHRILDRMPDHLAVRALRETRTWSGDN